MSLLGTDVGFMVAAIFTTATARVFVFFKKRKLDLRNPRRGSIMKSG